MEDFNTYDRSWIKRALDPNTPTTVAKETVKTASSEFNGKEILFPTIRLIDGKLKKKADHNLLYLDHRVLQKHQQIIL